MTHKQTKETQYITKKNDNKNFGQELVIISFTVHLL